MKGKQSVRCGTLDCQSKIQAACFTCPKLLCFQHSMQHAQKFSSNPHQILELEEAVKEIEKDSGQILNQIKILRSEGEKENKTDSEDYTNMLHPQKFQQQLDEISFMKKETLKVVQKFYSQISLQIVNMWEFYLKKFSSVDETIERLKILENKTKYFAYPNPKESYDELINSYFQQTLEIQVKECSEKLKNRSSQLNNIPQCPSIRIDDRVLVELSQCLCSCISTENYTKIQGNKKKLNITNPNYFVNSVKEIPIFPIKKPHCYLYNMQSKSYEIQQFKNLDYLPDYPKSIVLPNGDIHIIGGIKKKQIILNSHLVFRSASSEVFKLGTLLYPINPMNSLIYHNKCIFLIGGMTDKSEWTKKGSKYSLQKKQWEEIAPMHATKPHQSACIFNNSIYAFGIPQAKKINIEKYDIGKNCWQQVNIKNFLSNPFNFASGFATVQINDNQLLFMGGKKFLENVVNSKRSTDRQLSSQMYLFRPETNSFVQLGKLFPCLGVQYGQFHPVIYGGSILLPEYLLSKNNPISRWYDNLHIVQLTNETNIQSVAILNET